MIQSIEVHAGPNDEAYGAPVKNLCPALFFYLSPKLSFMWTPNGETVTALKPSAFKPTRALVISALVQFCAMAHEDMVLGRYTLPFWSRKRRSSALTLAGQAKVGVVPVTSSAEELSEAVPSFPRPARVPFCGGEPDVGVAANVGSKVAATISRDLNTYKRLKDRVVTERSVCGVRSR
jgi:hypothetical protein